MIDLKTFILVLALGNIGFAALIAGYARSAREHAAMRVWMWAKLFLGGAQLLAWLRAALPWPWLGVAAYILLICGLALEVSAYRALFAGSRWQRGTVALASASLLVFFGVRLAGASLSTLTGLMSLIIALHAALMIVLLLRAGRRDSALRWTMVAVDAVLVVTMCARAWNGIVVGGQTVFSPGLVQYSAFLAAYLMMIVNGFGFLMLCKEKDDRALATLATVDSLTGLLNRRAFLERADSARLLALRLRKPVALMMLDLDHFKQLNDRFGHAAGDAALRQFAAIGATILREHDVMGRLGGEEFALVMPGTDEAGALNAAERLRQAVAEGRSCGGLAPGCAITVSIGVVVIDVHESLEAALARADHALYAAKKGGRDQVACHAYPRAA